MAGKLVRMSKIKQVLQMHKSGMSNRRIGQDLGLYKGTVNDYIRKVKENGFDIETLLKTEDPVLEKMFSPGTPAYTDKRFEVLKDKLSYFEKELERPHVTRHLLWQEYLLEHPEGYRYSQFCYHLSQLRAARSPSAVLDHSPGEKLYIDFTGKRLSYTDRETGEMIEVQTFIACFPYSDYTFVMAVPSQSTEDFLHALECALRFFGGSPKILVPDNLKAAVIKADRYEPDLNRVLEDFANHYGFVVIPARPYRPRDKSTVETHVQIIYNRVYARLRNETFFSTEDINAGIRAKLLDHNQTRMQQKNYSREEKFLADEKQALKALPRTPFELKYYTCLRVAKNNHIFLGRDNHYYSVPYSYIGQEVSVIYTRTLVSIYRDGKAIATHPRKVGYGYTTDRGHLCSTHKHYRDRSPDYYIALAEKRSDELARLIRLNFEKEEIPELVYKRCDGLLSLQKKTDPYVFDTACRYALKHGILSCKSLKKIIENKAYELEKTEQTEQKKMAPHLNIRGKEYYSNHIKTNNLWNKSNQN